MPRRLAVGMFIYIVKFQEDRISLARVAVSQWLLAPPIKIHIGTFEYHFMA